MRKKKIPEGVLALSDAGPLAVLELAVRLVVPVFFFFEFWVFLQIYTYTIYIYKYTIFTNIYTYTIYKYTHTKYTYNIHIPYIVQSTCRGTDSSFFFF